MWMFTQIAEMIQNKLVRVKSLFVKFINSIKLFREGENQRLFGIVTKSDFLLIS